jgi:hypothetical protein
MTKVIYDKADAMVEKNTQNFGFDYFYFGNCHGGDWDIFKIHIMVSVFWI